MNDHHSPHSILMVRPNAFGYNEQTSGSNAFQQKSESSEMQDIHNQAVTEFDAMVRKLEAHDINVLVVEDSKEPVTPDAIFPNNWISIQPDGKIILYPMEAENRRAERRTDIIEMIKNKFQVREVLDYSDEELSERYLEGTGSIVFDHGNKLAYSNYSSRTNIELLNEICEVIGYTPIVFNAKDESGKDIYHTNVLMCIGSDYALICLDAIKIEDDLDLVINSLNNSGKKIISISTDQMNAFAGNMLEVSDDKGECYLVMSETAFQSLVNGQINAITQHVEMITIDIPTIEKYGGGGVRCMMAGIHLPKKN